MTQNSYYWDGVNITEDLWKTWIRFMFTRTPTTQGPIKGYLNGLSARYEGSHNYVVDTGAAIVDGTYYENTSPVILYIPSMAYANPYGLFWIFYIVLTKSDVSHTVRANVVGPFTSNQTFPILSIPDYNIPLLKVEVYNDPKLIEVATIDIRAFCKFTGIFPDEA
jgi:hypothetical protein